MTVSAQPMLLHPDVPAAAKHSVFDSAKHFMAGRDSAPLNQ